MKEPAAPLQPVTVPEDVKAESRHLSYEGTPLPWYVLVIWIGFLAFGFVYFARFLLR